MAQANLKANYGYRKNYSYLPKEDSGQFNSVIGFVGIAFIIAILFVIAGGATGVFAQGVMLGPKAGINIAQIKLPKESYQPSYTNPDGSITISSVQPVMGANAGMVFNIGFNKTLSLQPEICFSQKGLKWKMTNEDMSMKMKIVMNYLEFPVLFKATFGSGSFKVFANAGPYAGYWFGAKVKLQQTYMDGNDQMVTIDTTYKYSMTEIENGFEAGLAAGAGCGLMLGNGMLSLDARYHWGWLAEGEIKNRVLGISLSYTMRLGKR